MAVKRLDDYRKLLQQATTAVQRARASICDLSWGAPAYYENDRQVAQAHERFIEAVISSCRRRGGPIYQEVATFPTRKRIDRTDRKLKKLSASPNYHLRYYDFGTPEGEQPNGREPPLMTFILFDAFDRDGALSGHGEVFVVGYRAPYGEAAGETRLRSSESLIVALFADYYRAIWDGGKPLKDNVGGFRRTLWTAAKRGPTTRAKPDEPLDERQLAALEVLLSQDVGHPVSAKELAHEVELVINMSGASKAKVTEEVLRKHIIPALREKGLVTNHRNGLGYLVARKPLRVTSRSRETSATAPMVC